MPELTRLQSNGCVSLTVLLGVVHGLVGGQHSERVVGQSEGTDDDTLRWKTPRQAGFDSTTEPPALLHLGLLVGVRGSRLMSVHGQDFLHWQTVLDAADVTAQTKTTALTSSSSV